MKRSRFECQSIRSLSHWMHERLGHLSCCASLRASAIVLVALVQVIGRPEARSQTQKASTGEPAARAALDLPVVFTQAPLGPDHKRSETGFLAMPVPLLVRNHASCSWPRTAPSAC